MSLFSEKDFKAATPSSAPFFIFENEGDTLEGEVTNFSLRDGNYGEQLVLTVKHGNREFRVSTSGILRDQVEKAGGNRVGVLLGIRYNGLVRSKNNRQYKSYSVATKEKGFFDI